MKSIRTLMALFAILLFTAQSCAATDVLRSNPRKVEFLNWLGTNSETTHEDGNFVMVIQINNNVRYRATIQVEKGAGDSSKEATALGAAAESNGGFTQGQYVASSFQAISKVVTVTYTSGDVLTITLNCPSGKCNCAVKQTKTGTARPAAKCSSKISGSAYTGSLAIYEP